jgi:hypothetical protein
MTPREKAKQYFEQQRPKELEVGTDLHAIMHILTALPAQDDSEAEWERVLELDSAWLGFQNKYPQDMLDDLEQAIGDVIDVITEKLLDGDYGDE